MDEEALNILLYEGRVPYYVIHKHIIPYTYLPQSKELLRDIRNYTQDIKLIEDVYLTQYNEFILLTDLLLFHGYNVNVNYISNSLGSLMSRYVMLKQKDMIDLNNYMVIIRHPNRRKRSIKFLWGLMDPEERTKFINDYVLNTMTD